MSEKRLQSHGDILGTTDPASLTPPIASSSSLGPIASSSTSSSATTPVLTSPDLNHPSSSSSSSAFKQPVNFETSPRSTRLIARDSSPSDTIEAESTSAKVHFGPAIRRGGWRNFASVAASRDHSDQSGTDDEAGPSQSSSAGSSRPKPIKRGSRSSRVSSTTSRRVSTKSLGDDDEPGEDDQEDGLAVAWARTKTASTSGPAVSLDELPTMPTPRNASPTDPGAIPTAADFDWANFIHSYARGKWDGTKQPKAPGQSSVLPGVSTRIAFPRSVSDAAASDGYITPEPSDTDSRRPSLGYDIAGLAKHSPSLSERRTTTKVSLQSALEEARRRGSLEFSPPDFAGRPTLFTSPALFREAATVDVTDEDLRRRQNIDARFDPSSPRSNARSSSAVNLHLDSTTPAQHQEQQSHEAAMAGLSAQQIDPTPRSTQSASGSGLPMVDAGQNMQVDDTVWQAAYDVVPISAACDTVPGQVTPQAPAAKITPKPAEMEEQGKTPLQEDGKEVALPPATLPSVPHLRPGPTPVQLQDYNLAGGVTPAAWQSAPDGLFTGWRMTPGRAEGSTLQESDMPFWVGEVGENGTVAGLRRAARRASVLRGGDESSASLKPINIHAGSYVSDPGERPAILLQHRSPRKPSAREQALHLSPRQQGLAHAKQLGPQNTADGDSPSSSRQTSERSVAMTVPTYSRMIVSPSQGSNGPGVSRADSASGAYLAAGKQAENFFIEHGYLPAVIPPNEAQRRKALNRYGMLNAAGDRNFDRIGHLVRLVFNAEVVLISLVGSNAQYLQTALGGANVSHDDLQRIAGSRHCSFCAHAILQDSEEPLVVLDATKDWRFMGNPLVLNEPHIRFYAGAPLRTADGLNLGSLCLVDSKPRTEFSPRQRHTLKEFAAIVMREMELARDHVHLTLRHRMQVSIEVFARDCLEMESRTTSDDDDAEESSGLANLYTSAAKAMQESLQVSGAVVFDLSHFELIDSPVNDSEGTVGPGSSKIFYPSPISAPEITPYASFDDPTVIQIISSSNNRAEEAIEKQLVPAMAILGSSENEEAPPHRGRPVPLSHHIRIADFFRKHRNGHFYPMIPTVFRRLLPPSSSSLLLVPIFGLNKQPFALLCAYSKADQKSPALEDVKESALQYIRSMGTIILSAVLKKDIMLADQAKSHFISNISHELRTPLHGILASAELLADTKLNSTQGSYLETVEACGKSLLELVNHVLDFTKLSGGARVKGNAVHSLTPCDLVKLLQEVCESSWIGQMARRLESQQTAGIGSAYGSGTAGVGMEVSKTTQTDGSTGGKDGATMNMKTGDVETIIDVSMRSSGWLVNCDAGGIRRVLMNLIGNSLKFTSAGFVHVSLREVQSTATHVVVELSVTDTGRGISRSFLEQQLFHPFTQENELGPGTGLGLSIVNSIVQSPSINGKIDVWSTLGQGTEMRITCEMAIAQPDDIEGAVYQPSLNLERKRRVSFAGFEDSKGQLDLKQVLRNYFEGWWSFAPSSEEEGDDFDGDIILVNEDASLLEDLRSKRKGRLLPPVILLTSARGDGDVTDACEAYHAAGGIARMLFKPAGPAKLEGLVDFCLQCLERIEKGQPPETTQTAPSTPLPSPAPSPAIRMDMERSNSYFALPSSDGAEAPTPDSETATTPSNTATVSTPWREVAAEGEDETPRTDAVRPPLAPLKADSNHMSPKVLEPVNASLIRRHSTEDEIIRHKILEGPPSIRRMVDGSSRAAQQGVEGVLAEAESTLRQASVEHQSVNKRPPVNPVMPSRPLMPPRSITFHAEPRLEKHVTLSPSMHRDRGSKDYFSVQSQSHGQSHGGSGGVPTRNTSSPKQTQIPPPSLNSPGPVVVIDGTDGQLLRSAVGTLEGTSSGLTLDQEAPKGGMGTGAEGGRRLRVLGVDDNKINIKILSAYMSKLDVDFTSASNGAECVQLFERTNPPFDVIILDLTMPILDGFQATLAIRRKEGERFESSMRISGTTNASGAASGNMKFSSSSSVTRRVKILCLTGRNSAEDKRKAFSCGADGFMTRPLSLKVLSSVLRLLTQPPSSSSSAATNVTQGQGQCQGQGQGQAQHPLVKEQPQSKGSKPLPQQQQHQQQRPQP